ncbi:MAG: phosphonate C-P lyase system protein PhnL [Bryobacterales bacterium]|nr:phosphonate C-P lyase system protein PhnL [Bryobacterales bacterium]
MNVNTQSNIPMASAPLAADPHRSSLPAIAVRQLRKDFTLHGQGGARLPGLNGIDLDVFPGECVVLTGPSGSGKSTLLRILYGNYSVGTGSADITAGALRLRLHEATPRQVLAARRFCIGYASQFLRVIPRVPAIEVVTEPARRAGVPRQQAQERAESLLRRLSIPERLWLVPPATFSGGEQQRVNLARVFCFPYPILLLDEPTASLDAANSEEVLSLIAEARAAGAAILAVFHDHDLAGRVASRFVTLQHAVSLQHAVTLQHVVSLQADRPKGPSSDAP